LRRCELPDFSEYVYSPKRNRLGIRQPRNGLRLLGLRRLLPLPNKSLRSSRRPSLNFVGNRLITADGYCKLPLKDLAQARKWHGLRSQLD
jgi:hypothetical protein